MKKMTLSISSAALLWGAAGLFPAASQAASCCGGGSAATLSVPKYAVAVADLSFDTELYDGYWDQNGTHRSDPPDANLKQLRLNMGLGYRFAKDWQTSISIPYVYNDNTYSGVSSETNGMGDMTVSISYDLLDDKSSWKVYEAKDLIPAITVGMSLLLPTGISPYDEQKSSFDITGRGFYRLDGTLLVEKTVRPWNVSLALAYGTWFDRSVNREYGKYVEPYTKGLGDRFNASAAAGYTFIIGSGGDSITTTTSYAYLNEGNARYNGSSASDSGFAKQSLGTAVAYSSTDHNWGVRLGWNHAIQQNGWGRNFPTTDVLSVGVRYVFL
jgi:hypothetical protein